MPSYDVGKKVRLFESKAFVENVVESLERLHMVCSTLPEAKAFINLLIQDCFSSDKISVLQPDSFHNLIIRVLDNAILQMKTYSAYFEQHKNLYLDGKSEHELSNNVRLSLHDGLCGVLVYISAAYKIIRNEEYRIFGSKVALIIIREMKVSKCTNIGGSYGIGSVVYSLAYASVCMKDKALLLSAIELIGLISTEIVLADKSCDIFNGSAGCILSLVAVLDAIAAFSSFDTETPVEYHLIYEKALFCGNHLINKLESLDFHISSHLTGFSHGLAGVSYALNVLANISGIKIYSEFADRAEKIEDNYKNIEYV
jgi:hypothetical protein